VPNPSFETLLHCPTTPSLACGGPFNDEIAYCTTNWHNVGCGSADYYNSCDTVLMGVPNTYFGYQYARTGVAFTGLIVYPLGYNEYLGTFLTSTLVTGVKYYVRFYTNHEPNMLVVGADTTDALGALLTNGEPDTTGSMIDSTFQGVIHQTAQINNPNGLFLIDTLNWMLVSGSFIATGIENFITIGNFKDTSMTHGFGYYYIDDVYVGTDSLSSESVIENNSNNITSVFPNPFDNKISISTEENEPTQIILYDLSSRKLLQQTFTNSTTINTEQLAKGMYLYTVRNRNGIIKNGKVIKQ
jgi:hypothetical protein